MKRKLLVLTVIALMFAAVAAAEHEEPNVPPCSFYEEGVTNEPEGDHPFYNYDLNGYVQPQDLMSYLADCGTNASYIDHQDQETLENAQHYADQNDATGSSYGSNDFREDINEYFGSLFGGNNVLEALKNIFATNDRVAQLENRVDQLEGQKSVLRVQVEEHHGEPDVSLLAEVAADNNLTELTYGDRSCHVYESYNGTKFRCVR